MDSEYTNLHDISYDTSKDNITTPATVTALNRSGIQYKIGAYTNSQIITDLLIPNWMQSINHAWKANDSWELPPSPNHWWDFLTLCNLHLKSHPSLVRVTKLEEHYRQRLLRIINPSKITPNTQLIRIISDPADDEPICSAKLCMPIVMLHIPQKNVCCGVEPKPILIPYYGSLLYLDTWGC